MVAQSTITKQANALVTLFIKEYTDKYKTGPSTLNRYREKWAFQDMVTDLGYERAQEVVQYYFRTGKSGHPVQWFIYHYEELNNIMKELEKDKLDQARWAKETEERVRKWEESIGNQGS